MQQIFLTILTAVLAYLIGSIASGLLIARAQGVDIRASGSKNTGASNMLRVMGAKLGLLTFFADVLKALIACIIGDLLLPGETFGIPMFGAMLGAFFVVVGHNWPVFFQFRGGKGVACSVAVVLYINPLWGLVASLICLATIFLTKYVSLGSMVLLFSYMILMCIAYFGQWSMCIFVIVMCALCLWRHRENIVRLLKGEERKFGQRAKAESTKK